MQERLLRQGGRIKRQKICNVEPKMVMKILHYPPAILPSNPVSLEFPKTFPTEMRPNKFPGPKN